MKRNIERFEHAAKGVEAGKFLVLSDIAIYPTFVLKNMMWQQLEFVHKRFRHKY